MKTYNLEQAAAFLHMSAGALRERAKSGEIRAAKPGRRWVFLEQDLIDYVRSQSDVIAANAKHQVVELCRSTVAERSTGFVSPRRMAREYADRLALPASERRRNFTIA